MQIAIELPNDFLALEAQQQVQREMRLAYGLWLFKAARVTLAKAAELAGMDIYDFMSACKENQVPVIDLSREELVQELEDMAVR